MSSNTVEKNNHSTCAMTAEDALDVSKYYNYLSNKIYSKEAEPALKSKHL